MSENCPICDKQFHDPDRVFAHARAVHMQEMLELMTGMREPYRALRSGVTAENQRLANALTAAEGERDRLREALDGLPIKHHHHRHPWCQPGDRPGRVWILRFDDPDRREMIFRTSVDAMAAYERFAPTWNCTLLASVRVLTAPARQLGGDTTSEAG